MTTLSDPTAPPTRRRTRRALAAALAAVGLLALAGCMKVDMTFTLSEEDTVSGAIIMAVSDEFAESVGMDPQEMWDSMNEGEDSLTSDLPEGATQEQYAEDGYTGVRMTYDEQPIDTLAATDSEELSITREGDEYVVSGVMDLSDASTEETGEMPAEILDSFVMRIAVTFPGEVIESNGTVDGSTVTWEPSFGEVNEISARGSAVAGGGDGGAAEGDADGGGTAAPDTGTDDGATGGTDDGAAGDGSTDADAATTSAETDDGFPWWIVAVVVGLGVVGVVVALVVRGRRRPDPQTTSGTTDLFGQQGPPAQQPGQPPVDPYQQGGLPPTQPPQPPQDPQQPPQPPHEPR